MAQTHVGHHFPTINLIYKPVKVFRCSSSDFHQNKSKTQYALNAEN